MFNWKPKLYVILQALVAVGMLHSFIHGSISPGKRGAGLAAFGFYKRLKSDRVVKQVVEMLTCKDLG